MTLDFEAVAAGLNEAIPFNRFLGLVVEEVATMTVHWHVRRNS